MYTEFTLRQISFIPGNFVKDEGIKFYLLKKKKKEEEEVE